MIQPRIYQQEAHDAAIDWVRHTVTPCLIEAATGAGKSVMVAMIAKTLHDLSGKKIVCLAPTKELIEQNVEKYRALGEPCSIYSAAIEKSLKHNVVFATEGTFKKVARRIGGEFAAVVLDEAHKITPTIKRIIDDMRASNPNLRVIGLTATPYRVGDGYIYATDESGRGMMHAKDPYFARLVYRITAPQLIQMGFLTPPRIGQIGTEEYDTSKLVLLPNGRFSDESVEAAFVGQGRKTASIVADVVSKAHNKRGVMIFAATNTHAKEILDSLPPAMSRMIGGDVNMSKEARARLVSDFKAQRFKYLVSVGTMTTGVDFPHVDMIVVMRRTESRSLLQQIIGRGMRLFEGKEYFEIYDYAGNLEEHCPDGDIFAPEVKASHTSGEAQTDIFICPDCHNENEFTLRPNQEGLAYNRHGYFLDLMGDVMDMPAHYGRRCLGMVRRGSEYTRCTYFWTCKTCDICGHANDIAARRCEQCKTELIDPNEKLIFEFKEAKRDPHRLQTDEIVEISHRESLTKKGAIMLVVDCKTSSRKFTAYLFRTGDIEEFLKTEKRTISYLKETNGFWSIKAYNLPTDEERLQNEISRVA